MLIQQGIILRSFMPHHRKIIFFDAFDGVISAVPQNRLRAHIIQGALSHYQLLRYNTRTVISHIEVVALPAMPLRIDLQFLHHVLEMLFRFLPMSVQLRDVFDHCLLLYHDSISYIVERQRFQYLFLTKLFGMLGIYPHEDVFNKYQRIRLLVIQSFEDILVHGCEIALDDLRVWLLGCIYTHHDAHAFTTLAIY
jgi:hypothetical protein